MDSIPEIANKQFMKKKKKEKKEEKKKNMTEETIIHYNDTPVD